MTGAAFEYDTALERFPFDVPSMPNVDELEQIVRNNLLEKSAGVAFNGVMDFCG